MIFSYCMYLFLQEKRYKRNLEADDDMAAMVYQMKVSGNELNPDR